MRLRAVQQTFRDRPFFETKELAMLFDEPSAQIQARLSRWVEQDRLIQLRRGKYLLKPEDRRQEVSLYYVSNYLYRPSYVSLFSALEFHGLIPEAVGVVQAVTTRHRNQWETPAGRFHYYSLDRNRFRGYREYSSGAVTPVPVQGRFLLAVPEKALIDLFYLYPGEWTRERIEEMRFQNLDELVHEDLLRAAVRFESPKVRRAVHRLSETFSFRRASEGSGH
jgi:predicted transcriptional regulator of viral defense system